MAIDHPIIDPDRMREALARMPRVEREVLLLTALEHLSSEAIAAQLAITPGAVRRHLADAFGKLDRSLRQ